MADNRIPQQHLEILQESGILNPDLTLAQIMAAASKLETSFHGAEKSVPTLIGNWYVYHTIDSGEATVEQRS